MYEKNEKVASLPVILALDHVTCFLPTSGNKYFTRVILSLDYICITQPLTQLVIWIRNSSC